MKTVKKKKLNHFNGVERTPVQKKHKYENKMGARNIEKSYYMNRKLSGNTI